jgi:hypothetical protein
MRKKIILTLFSLTLSGGGMAQGFFVDCSKSLFIPSRPKSWQRDTTQSRTFVRNCHASTTYLVLYNDSTFQFKVDRCGPSGYAEGKWKIISRKRIQLYDSRRSERKLISIHKGDYSLTYMLEDVDSDIFRIKGTNLVKATN